MAETTKSKLISIVVPLFNEAANLQPFHTELAQTLTRLKYYKFEIIFVDDGSEDGSGRVLHKLARLDRRVRVVQLARNFGKEAAVSAGLHKSRGDAAIVIDSDMQMPPSLISEFLAKWQKGAEVVVGVFVSRNMQWTRKYGAMMFYKIMNIIGHIKITPHATDYRLLDRQVIDVFNRLTEHNRITRGMIDWMGFERAYINFDQRERHSGTPNYSMSKLIGLAVNSLTSYSFIPLKIAGYLGVVILVLSIPATIFLYILRFVLNNPWNWNITSTTFLAMLLLFLVGVIMACLGLIALYIAQIHTEVTDRPLYILRSKPRPVDMQEPKAVDYQEESELKLVRELETGEA